MSLRLAKDDARILCGVVDCGTALGMIDTGNAPMIARQLVLQPGYRREADGVLRMTAHALERLRRGQPPRRSGRAAFARSSIPLAAVKRGTSPCCLPVQVKCHRCGQVQTADPDELAVNNPRHPGRIEDRTYGPNEHLDAPRPWPPHKRPA